MTRVNLIKENLFRYASLLESVMLDLADNFLEFLQQNLGISFHLTNKYCDVRDLIHLLLPVVVVDIL